MTAGTEPCRGGDVNREGGTEANHLLAAVPFEDGRHTKLQPFFPPRRSPAFFFRLFNAKVETGFILITHGNLHRLPQLGDDFMEVR